MEQEEVFEGERRDYGSDGKSGRMRQRGGVRVEEANLASCCISLSKSCLGERKKECGMITVDSFFKQIYLERLTQHFMELLLSAV